ncbi:DUF485 domain-containing protein [Demetria terragena]|uniref:DUF485 domain-containing protein n=1 Tax=Demetria terragena TaxID=63959 RepID=UPI0003790237|nr:DUF485 domain-containing protein [Demetria terragena]
MSASTHDDETPLTPYQEMQRSPEFAELRRRFRAFVFPVTGFFLAWYFLYVLLSVFAPEFMGKIVFGSVSIGLLMGLGQFVTTFAITFWYARWAGKEFDPRADELGARLSEGDD